MGDADVLDLTGVDPQDGVDLLRGTGPVVPDAHPLGDRPGVDPHKRQVGALAAAQLRVDLERERQGLRQRAMRSGCGSW